MRDRDPYRRTRLQLSSEQQGAQHWNAHPVPMETRGVAWGMVTGSVLPREGRLSLAVR